MFNTEYLVSEVLTATQIDFVRFLGSDVIEMIYTDGTKNTMHKKDGLWDYVRQQNN